MATGTWPRRAPPSTTSRASATSSPDPRRGDLGEGLRAPRLRSARLRGRKGGSLDPGDLRASASSPCRSRRTRPARPPRRGRPCSDGGEAILLTGEAATESAFKSLAPGRSASHLATHGFFLGSGAAAPREGTRGSEGSLRPARRGGGRSTQSPLLLSGVAFAGANRRSEAAATRDDGILTAEEIAGLDLSSLEWAVLSACDTGTGKLDVSEGVLGLRRAFQAAGARTLITSLWSAEDRAAREWMRELYRARFQEGLGTAASRARGEPARARAPESRRPSTHPFYWAGFVAAGDWRWNRALPEGNGP